DIAAFGVQSRLISEGYKVPDDVAVAGFGNFEVSRFAVPKLSTVVVDPVRIGSETGKLLKKLLVPNPSRDTPAQQILVPAEVEFREST
ncbi:MAG: substrate-binding domain-containing protein, partial [Pseudomonadota bacterium]